MNTRHALVIAIALAVPSMLSGADLNQQTLKAWDQYIQATNAEMQNRLAAGGPFLRMDEEPGRRERVRQGEIWIGPARSDNPSRVPHGLIHHWVGDIFVPHATTRDVSDVLGNYQRYARIYDPVVINARLLEDSGKRQRFSMLLLEKEPFVTAAIDSEYLSQSVRIDDRRSYAIIYSTRIQEIEDYGRPRQRELPPDQGAGFVWRFYSIQRFEEKDGGVYVECEVIALSRDIPVEMLWLVKPILAHLPRTAMAATLQKTRDAVCTSSSSKAPDLAQHRQSPQTPSYIAGALLATRGVTLERQQPAAK